jgi:beta-phosphoglucomutase-like phosphatase (HAD superfamily)
MHSAVSAWILVRMISSATSRVATTRSGRAARRAAAQTALPTRDALEFAAQRPRPFELDTISSRWQLALDAAELALRAAGDSLPPTEVAQHRRKLAHERQETAELLAGLARLAGIRSLPWLSPVPVTTEMLGLPATVSACVFDLEGVLTDTALLHAQAWGEVFDEFLLRLSENTGWHFIRFDRDADYRAYLDGRSRLEGVDAFLGSRGIRLPEGRVDDPAGADTAHGLARRKGEALARALRQRGVTALDGARRYLEAAGHAGLKRAVVSASASTLPMLELAGLATLVDEYVDADVIRTEGLRSRPAPDLLLVACRRLGVRPQDAVTLTHSAAGVAAGNAARLAVIGVGEGPQSELLLGFGAERVVPLVSDLLDPRLSDTRHRDAGHDR